MCLTMVADVDNCTRKSKTITKMATLAVWRSDMTTRVPGGHCNRCFLYSTLVASVGCVARMIRQNWTEGAPWSKEETLTVASQAPTMKQQIMISG